MLGENMAGKRAEWLKEQIKYETELLKAMLLVTVAAVGGTLTLLLGAPTRLRAALAGAGILVRMVLRIGVWRQNQVVRTLLAQLREELP
jgi:hypothetical protein